MQSKNIEKILNGDNKALNKIIEIVRNNAVFQEVMSDFKEEFFIDDNIHGISHNERVALLACYIGIQEGLNDDELRLVLEAAKYHDIGRGFEGNHGQYSAIIIDRNKEHIFPNLSEDEINTIKALCHGHSVDDKRYIEIAKLYGIENIEKFKKLLDIVKDADALDRVRLPRFGQLEEKYLRTETSKRIIDFSKELFREYRDIQQETTKENLREHDVMSNYQANTGLRSQLLFDGENYYLVRSLNKGDIESFDKENGIIPKIDNNGGYTAQDVMAQIRMQHRKTNLISMSEEPNIVLTYDKSNLHRFVLIKLSKDEIGDSKKVFSAGEYLLGVMDYQIEMQAQNAPLKVRQILERVDNASSIEEIIRIINGADRQVATSLVESKQQYLSEAEQLEQSKKIAKCKVLNYYGLMRGITRDEKEKLIDISAFTQIMRNGYSSSEWLYSGKIEQEKLIDISKMLVDALALVKQAEFQGKDKEILNQVEKEILSLVSSGAKIDQDNYQLEYSAHNNLKSELTIDKAFEITGGQISYRDTNMQMTAIRSLAEMTLNKRKIIELLQERLQNINVDELLSDTYCVNQEMVTRQNNRGNQIGKNINFIISDYGYDLDDEVSAQILQNIENLSDEQLSNIISKGVDAQEISSLLIKTRENNERIQSFKSKSLDSQYIAEAIVEGYNWRKDGNSLTIKEKELLANKLLLNVVYASQLHTLYEAINKIQIGKNKFTQNEIFAIIINISIDGRIGNIYWKDLLEKEQKDIQNILLDNKEELQTSVLPISIDLLAGRGKEINKIKKELIDLGIDRDFIEAKDIRNVYIAKQIVEGYDFGKELTVEERKAIIIAVLNNSALNKKGRIYLTKLIQNIEQIGFNTQEIYGTIINLAVNGKILEGIGNYYYTYLLRNQKNTCYTLSQYKDLIQTQVTEGIILKAKSSSLHEKEQKEIQKELIDLGIDKEFLDLKDIKNVYVAKQIVEGYKFERELSREEKKALIRLVLDNKCLDIQQSRHLTTLIQHMEQIGFNTQEIYGMIINLAVNNNIQGIQVENGYTYWNLLSQNNMVYQIGDGKQIGLTNVTEGTILKAMSVVLELETQEKIKQELIGLGIDKDFIELKDSGNVYVAKQIVEEYDFCRELKQEEKKVLLKFILKSNLLNVNSCYLTSLIHNMEKIGLNPQEIYGMIINLAVNGNVLEEKGYGYNNLLGNVNNACKTIIKYKNKIQTSVTEGTILKAKSIDQSEDNQEKIKQELIDLGIDKDFIELKDIRNIYTAKEILDNYSFERELSREEKRTLIQALLNKSVLNKNMEIYLTTLIQNMEQIGFNIQEIYGIIINLCINGKILEETGYSYNDLLTNKNNSCQSIKDYKCFLQTKITKGTKLKVKSINQNKDYQEGIKRELINIGIDSDFVESKDIKNVYVAKQIVEGYNWGKELTVEEKKSIIIAVLNNSVLNKNGGRYLTTLIQNMEQIGFSLQEIYGMIINLGVNGKILEKTGFEYSILLQSKNSLTKINEYRHEIQTNVTRGTILKAKSLNLSEKEQEKIKQKLINLGIDKDFIESKDIGNVYIANQIVENYNFYENIRSEEKKAIVKAILDNAGLNKNGRRYISTMIYNLEQAGFGEQEIYGMIINLGINGSVSVEKGFSYKDFLSNTGNVWQIQKYKERIRTSVSKGMVIKAVSEQLSLEEQDKIKNELVSSGIDKDFLDSKDIRNIYTAKQIVENYNFARKLKNEEKNALLILILDNSKLNNKRANYLTKLIQNMEQIGLNIQQIYGMIINLGVDGNILDELGYGYTALLANKDNSCQTIIRHKERIHTQVTEETIQKAIKKANNPKKVKGQDIAKSTMELTVAGNGGSQVCDDVQADYQRLMAEKTKENEREGSEQDVPS